MIFHDIAQNSDEWFALRLGKLTASSMGKILANYGNAFGAPAKQLAINIACEQLTGRAGFSASYSNIHMDRGSAQEGDGRRLYEEQTFTDVTNGGFFENGFLGCSPDGLVDNGLIEIKSVIAHVHYANIKRNDFDPAYKWQKYFNLMFTGRDWIDFVSYCADFPEETQLFIHRKYKEECSEQFEMLNKRVSEFKALVEESKKLIRGNHG